MEGLLSTWSMGSSYNHSLMTSIVSHCCKETLLGSLHEEKIEDAVFPSVFKIAFLASLLERCLPVCAYHLNN